MSDPRAYILKGWLPIPLVAATKPPRPTVRWKQLVDLRAPFTEAFVQPWVMDPNLDTALLLEPSQLLVIDCDSPDAVKEAMGLTQEPCKNIVLTNKGAHFYYRKSDSCPAGRRIQCGYSGKIDILSAGITVAPPSRHPNGYRYKWLCQGELQEAPAWASQLLAEVRQRSIESAGVTPEEALAAFPNTPEDLFALQVALKAVNPLLYAILAGTAPPGDRSRSIWLLMNTLIRLRLRKSRTIPEKLDDKSIAKIVWYGTLGEKPRERGWRWLCDEIARARLEITPS
jgi:hypothetical protein